MPTNSSRISSAIRTVKRAFGKGKEDLSLDLKLDLRIFSLQEGEGFRYTHLAIRSTTAPEVFAVVPFSTDLLPGLASDPTASHETSGASPPSRLTGPAVLVNVGLGERQGIFDYSKNPIPSMSILSLISLSRDGIGSDGSGRLAPTTLLLDMWPAFGCYHEDLAGVSIANLMEMASDAQRGGHHGSKTLHDPTGETVRVSGKLETKAEGVSDQVLTECSELMKEECATVSS